MRIRLHRNMVRPASLVKGAGKRLCLQSKNRFAFGQNICIFAYHEAGIEVFQGELASSESSHEIIEESPLGLPDDFRSATRAQELKQVRLVSDRDLKTWQGPVWTYLTLIL